MNIILKNIDAVMLYYIFFMLGNRGYRNSNFCHIYVFDKVFLYLGYFGTEHTL